MKSEGIAYICYLRLWTFYGIVTSNIKTQKEHITTASIIVRNNKY